MTEMERPNDCPDSKCFIIPLYNKLVNTDPGKAQGITREVCAKCIQLAKNTKALQKLEATFLKEYALKKDPIQPQR